MFNSQLSNSTLYGTGSYNLAANSTKLQLYNKEVDEKLENWKRSVENFNLSNFEFFKKHGWANKDIPKIFYQGAYTDMAYDKHKCGYSFSPLDPSLQTMAQGGNIPCTIATMMHAIKIPDRLGGSPYVVARTLYDHDYLLEDNSTDNLAIVKFFLDNVIGINDVAESVSELYSALDDNKVVSALVDSSLMNHKNSSEECIIIWRICGSSVLVSSSLSPEPLENVKLVNLLHNIKRAWILTKI